MIRNMSRRIVEGLGYHVAEAENGEEALARCKTKMPSLILLDWNMPVMGGLDFVKALNGIDGARPKVVFCTTNNDALDIHKAIEAGANEFVIKPFDERTLKAKLERIGAA
jgi:two-component system chemotaxis response regulator CheY